MGGPPSINLLGEIYICIALLNINYIFFFPLILTLFLAIVYTLILYRVSQQGNQSKNII